ncbi:MAG: DUF6029 family protein [Balneola sp.]
MKNIGLISFFVAFGSLGFLEQAEAQLYGTNTFEFQYGNLPFEENTDLTTSYNQLNLYYDSGKFSLFGKAEQFLSPVEDRNYFELTQKRFQYQDDNFRIRLGNFYETIGSGLLLRSYDIPGSVFESDFYRTRYAFFRDLEGVAFDVNLDWAELKIIRSQPLQNDLPPNFEPDSVRRPDLVEAIQATFYPTENLSVGGAFMRVNTPNNSDYSQYASLMTNIQLPANFQLFGEYAIDTESDPFSFNEDQSYALYSGLNYYHGSFGASLEYKNYNDFRLGSSGFNDPPSLIKEHTYPILNRSTHVPNTSNEQGVQAELFYTFEGDHSLVANYAYTINEVARRNEYREYFIEGTYKFNDQLSLKSFLDYAVDEPKQQDNRISIGLITDKSFGESQNVIVDLQYQTYDESFQPEKIENYFASLSYSFNSSLNISAVFEASTEPGLTDNPNTFPEIETNTRTWLGFNSLYRINTSNSLALFVGKRRGGPACTSGICYEILDFEGAEVRITTRF